MSNGPKRIRKRFTVEAPVEVVADYDPNDCFSAQVLRVIGPLPEDLRYLIADEITEGRGVIQPTTGLGDLIGSWPGDETDEQIDAALKEMS